MHLDLYRVATPDELWELGWQALGADHEIVIVEWPERAETLMLANHWLIEISAPPGHAELRDVEVRRFGAPPDLAGFPMSVTGS